MLPAAIRRLSYNPVARMFAQRLHVGGFARRLYCRFLSSSGALHFSCSGVEVLFQTHNSKQLGFVDSVVTTERDVIQETLGALQPGDTFLDVGCNFGAYSIVASKLVGSAGRVIAVDPHPGTLQVLQENLELNHCENVEVLNVAFTDKTGALTLSYNEHGSHRQRACDPTSTLRAVRAIAGDEALCNIPTPAAVKIDVEGHEFAVLFGLKGTLSNAGCRLLCVEIHPQLLPSGVDQDSIITFIRERGFNSVKQMAGAGMTKQSLQSCRNQILVIATR